MFPVPSLAAGPQRATGRAGPLARGRPVEIAGCRYDAEDPLSAIKHRQILFKFWAYTLDDTLH